MTKSIFMILFYLAVIFGQIRCGYKALMCNWDPIGKSEIIYTAAFFTGTGAVIGYFNIQDK